jgi:hypothetical protein
MEVPAQTTEEIEQAAEALEQAHQLSLRKREVVQEYVTDKPGVIGELQRLNSGLARLLEENPVMTRQAAKEFLAKFETLRSEDQVVIVSYLGRVTQALTDFMSKYQFEMRLQAEHREKEQAVLATLEMVLQNYL